MMLMKCGVHAGCVVLKVVSCFLEFFDEYPMPLLEQFEFTFACESRYGADNTMIYGTGGQILGELRKLLANLRNLSCLSVSHLLLDVSDAVTLFDSVVENSRDTLRSLQLLNITRSTTPLALAVISAVIYTLSDFILVLVSIIAHADGSRVSIALIHVCDSVCLSVR